MAVENFLNYTESDPNSRLTVTETRATFTGYADNENILLSSDKGVDYFSADFTNLLDISITAIDAGSDQALVWAMTNSVADKTAIGNASGSGFFARVFESGGILYLYLYELDSGDEYASAGYGIGVGFTYYLKIVRDEAVGANGTLYLYTYSDAARTDLLNTQSITLHTSKKDFRYLFGVSSWGGTGTTTTTGYVENLSLTAEPSVTNQAVTAIAFTTATGNGSVTEVGVPVATQYGHCWSTTASPTTANSKTSLGTPSAGAFTSSLTGLSGSTKYYVRAYITNPNGTYYSSEVSFTTLATTNPVVTTQACTSVTNVDAVGNGTIVSVGDNSITQHGHCWSSAHRSPTTSDSKTQNGAGIVGNFTSAITGLEQNTVYYVRTYVTTSAGTFYGNEVELVTSSGLPIVTTQQVTAIASTLATGNLTLVNNGGNPITQYGVCWNTTGTPTTADSKTTEGASAVMEAKTSAITSLTPNTLYYLRAYATNSTGTGYGAEVQFTTRAAGAPVVVSVSVVATSESVATGTGRIDDIGAASVTEHGWCWGTSANPDTTDSKTTEGAGTVGEFTSSITGLTGGTTYYARAYATNSYDTSYGDNIEFVAGRGSATEFPSTALARVTGIIHRYDRRRDIYQIEVSLGDVTSILALSYEQGAKRATDEKNREQTAAPIIDEAVRIAFEKMKKLLVSQVSDKVTAPPLHLINVKPLTLPPEEKR